MIQIQVLNRVLTDKHLGLIMENGLDRSFFSQYQEEYDFITRHVSEYGNVPDDETMLEKFPGFELLDVTETDRYLIDAIYEERMYNEMVPILNTAAEKMQNNSLEAVKFILPKVQKLLETSKFTGGVDIMKNTSKRWEYYQSLKDNPELLGISTGLPELDLILGGWLPGEELVTIAGRPNQGKSWILDIFLTKAWEQGKKVLLYSGEMSHQLISARVDTIVSGLSNNAIQRAGLDEQGEKRYRQHLQDVEEKGVPFIVVTPKDLGNKYLTMTMLDTLIQKYNPDIIGIDQLSLVADERGERDPLRIQIGHITQDAFQLSAKYGKPILLDVQANRNAQDRDPNSPPDLEDLSEGDATGQNSSRVLTIRQTKEGLKIGVKKNRYGQNNVTLTYCWTIDKAQLTFMPSDENEDSEDTGARATELKARNRKQKQEVENKTRTKGDVF